METVNRLWGNGMLRVPLGTFCPPSLSKPHPPPPPPSEVLDCSFKNAVVSKLVIEAKPGIWPIMPSLRGARWGFERAPPSLRGPVGPSDPSYIWVCVVWFLEFYQSTPFLISSRLISYVVPVEVTLDASVFFFFFAFFA